MKGRIEIVAVLLLCTFNVYAALLDLRIIETTDLHGNMIDYDYYKDESTQRYGLVRTASLIHKVRSEVLNSVLVDNGDLIQGSAMADYVADQGVDYRDIHPAYKAMNSLEYTVGTLGNHEFNYGLAFLNKMLSGAKFPYINSNVFDAKTGEHYFKPYIIIDTPVVDREGNQVVIKIGYLGFVPPAIVRWDKQHLEGKVTTRDITEMARELVPVLRSQGADVVVVIAHSGLSMDPYKAMAENSVYYLSTVMGIDAILFGHAHAVFPSKDFAGLLGVNIEKGLINQVPAVMPGQWGDHLGVIDLVLEQQQGGWQVIDGKATALPIYDKINNRALVEPDQSLRELLEDEHQQTRQFVGKKLGSTSKDLYNYLVMVQDDPTIELINAAQRAYVEYFIQGDPDLSELPVLAAQAPFRAGGRKNDPMGYVEIAKGELNVRHTADLYPYSNTLVALKITGAELKEWLECSAQMFNQIDTNNPAPQNLLNWKNFRTYNFDVIDGVAYQIDITQPSRYIKACELIHPDSHRIVNLMYQGKPVEPEQYFLISTNDYRAFSANFPGTGKDHVVFVSPDKSREILAQYIQRVTQQQGEIMVETDNNWSIKPIVATIPLDIRIELSPKPQAKKYISEHSQYPMKYMGQDEVGFAIYQIKLQP